MAKTAADAMLRQGVVWLLDFSIRQGWIKLQLTKSTPRAKLLKLFSGKLLTSTFPSYRQRKILDRKSRLQAPLSHP
jgi:hypothetical protein